MTTTLLIDADVLAYQSAFTAQANIQWKEELWTVHTDLAIAKTWIVDRLETFKKRMKADDFILAISDKNNFRRKLNSEYKANRRSKFAPIGLDPIRAWLAEEYGTVIYPNLEADDVLAILATERPNRKDKRIIVSVDKDFKSVPCAFYDFNRGELHETTNEQADRYHLIQTLAGDPVDGYKGVPRIGVKSAEKLLDTYGATWDTVLNAYKKAHMTEQDALMNAWMAYLIRKDEYNNKQKQIKYLWMPKCFDEKQKRKYSNLIHQVTGDLDEDLSRQKPFDPISF